MEKFHLLACGCELSSFLNLFDWDFLNPKTIGGNFIGTQLGDLHPNWPHP